MDSKSFNQVLQAAFEAGARFGAAYPEFAAIPAVEFHLRYDIFRGDLAGNPWSAERIITTRKERYQQRDQQRKIDHARYHHRGVSECGSTIGSCRYGLNCVWEPSNDGVDSAAEEPITTSTIARELNSHRPALSERQERLRRDPTGPGHDCNY